MRADGCDDKWFLCANSTKPDDLATRPDVARLANKIDSPEMVLDIVKYGTPVLRQRGARIEKITLEITKLIEDMFDTMRAARGVGLAAQQIGRALQLTVIDVSEVT